MRFTFVCCPSALINKSLEIINKITFPCQQNFNKNAKIYINNKEIQETKIRKSRTKEEFF